MKDIDRITLADKMMDIFSGYVQGYIGIYYDMLGYLNGISFMGYDFQSYPNSQKISLNILSYPFISYHIPTYPKISSGANSQMSHIGEELSHRGKGRRVEPHGRRVEPQGRGAKG
jgi:hypothetical protein